MSTHNLDVSGARPLTITTNDPSRTAASTGAKSGDDVTALVSGCRELRFFLPPSMKIERRRYVRKVAVKDESGRPMKDDAGDFLYEDQPYEELVGVIAGASITVFGRTSTDPRIDGDTKPFEGTPHTSVSVRRATELHSTESGELLEELDVRSVVPIG